MKKADKIIYIVLVAILVGLGLFFIFNIRPQSVTDKAATQSITTASVPVLSTSSIQTTNQATNNIASSGVAVHSASSLTTYSSTASVISSAKPSTIKISLIVDSTTGTGPVHVRYFRAARSERLRCHGCSCVNLPCCDHKHPVFF